MMFLNQNLKTVKKQVLWFYKNKKIQKKYKKDNKKKLSKCIITNFRYKNSKLETKKNNNLIKQKSS